MLKIHDIKPLEQIPDYSVYLYYSLIALSVCAVFIIIFLIYRYFRSKKDIQKINYYNQLKNIDFSDTKLSAYTISKYGYLLAQTSREKTLLNDLNHMLEPYKYKKDVPDNINDEIKVKLQTFMESLDV